MIEECLAFADQSLPGTPPGKCQTTRLTGPAVPGFPEQAVRNCFARKHCKLFRGFLQKSPSKTSAGGRCKSSQLGQQLIERFLILRTIRVGEVFAPFHGSVHGLDAEDDDAVLE